MDFGEHIFFIIISSIVPKYIIFYTTYYICYYN